MLTHKVSPSSRGEHSSQRSIHSEVHKPIQERSTLYVATSEGKNASGNDNYNNPIKQVSSTAKEWKASKSSPIAYPVACGLAAVSLGTLVCVCIKRSQTLRVHRDGMLGPPDHLCSRYGANSSAPCSTPTRTLTRMIKKTLIRTHTLTRRTGSLGGTSSLM